jgi:CelD/BcsL family acetyltransferase involved in cellulose biosynthesis
MLRVERLAGAQDLARITAEWEHLDATLLPRTPFTSPLWNTLWWKHFRQDRATLHDDFFVHVVRDDADRLVAVAPMMLTQRPARGPLRSCTLQFFGTDTNVTELRGLACRPGDQQVVVAALSKHFLSCAPQWDWIDWCGLHTGAGTAPWGETLPGMIPREREPLFYLPLPESWDEFRARLSRNVKESLRKCYNSLKRDGHSFELRVVERGAPVDAAIDWFLKLHTARADSTMKVSHKNVFASRASQSFLREYCQEMAQRNQLRIFQLVIEGKVVATRIGFLFGNELYLYYSGYDTDWSRYSVMTTTVAEALKWAIGERLSVANLSTGKDVSKTRWDPVAVTFSDGTQVAPNWRSRAAYNILDSVIRQRHTGSRAAKLLAVMRRGG